MTFSVAALPERIDDHSLSYNLVGLADDGDLGPGTSTSSGSRWLRLVRPNPDYYADWFEDKIIPELITEATRAMTPTDLERSRDLLKTAVLR